MSPESLEPWTADPLATAASWFQRAAADPTTPEPAAMAIATTDPAGPDVRMVLCKGWDVESGSLRFFTNLGSAKALALASLPRAAAVFWWPSLDAQVRARGPVHAVARDEVQAYFATRALESRISATVSQQSQPLAERAELEDAFTVALAGATTAGPPLAPDGWGGYDLTAERIELWCSRPARLHDRVAYRRTESEEPAPAEWAEHAQQTEDPYGRLWWRVRLNP